MNNLFLFAGTTEGRQLMKLLSSSLIEPFVFNVFTATEYGKEVLSGQESSKNVILYHRTGRLTSSEMAERMQQEMPLCVIDGTHPYAVEASLNIKEACKKTGRPYVRLLRTEKEEEKGKAISVSKDVIFVKDAKGAAEYVKEKEGTIFLTTGSKELQTFVAEVSKERIYVRVLPLVESLQECLTAGIPVSHIFCMQGPFSEELNGAMLRQINAAFLITKESGSAGGFYEKVKAAEKEGIPIIVIGRPKESGGYSLIEVLQLLKKEFQLPLTLESTRTRPAKRRNRSCEAIH